MYTSETQQAIVGFSVLKNMENMEIKSEKESTDKQNNSVSPSSNLAPKKGKKWLIAIFLVVVFFMAGALGIALGYFAGKAHDLSSSLVTKIERKLLGDNYAVKNNADSVQKIIIEDNAVISVVEKSIPSVVSITISKNVPEVRQYGFPFDFFGFDEQKDSQSGGVKKQQVGGGTGFFISKDGMVVTNKHVVDDANADYTVITNDGKEYPAKVLARDPAQDIAVIKIEGNDFPVLPLGNSDELKIGQTAIAIGNSLGEFSNTVSKGIISGLGRSLTAGDQYGGKTERLSNIIQTDAAINSGNSGGPLIDIAGNVIGINVAVAQNAQNVGFALPVNQVKRVVEQVSRTGKIITPFLGVRYIPINEDIAKENNLPFAYGVLVQRGTKITDFAVIPGSPADKAGIIENDIILEINEKKLDEKNQLSDMIATFNVGDTIMLKIWHKGETKEVEVVLQERK